MFFFWCVQTYLGTYTLLYVYWSLHTNLSLPRNYLPSFFTPFQSLLRRCYHIPLKSYMHTYFPLAYKPINIWQPFWSLWPTLSTHPWYYSLSPSSPSPPSTPYPFPLLSHHAWNKLIKGHQFRKPWKHKWHKTQVLKYKFVIKDESGVRGRKCSKVMKPLSPRF